MTSLTRRQLLRYGAAAAGVLALPEAARSAAAYGAAAGPLGRFLEALPVPGAGLVVASPGADGRYSFTQREITRQLHPQLPPTPVWAYDDGSGLSGQAGSLGTVVVAWTGTAIRADFTNALPARYPEWLPVDTRLTGFGDEVRALTHLHGGFVAADSDGNPAVAPAGFARGQTQSVYYPNEGPHASARMLWFHDHGLGVTRLNVLAGLAGGYLIRDGADTGAEPNPIGLPGGRYEVPLVIQDRQFNADGTIRYPVSTIPGARWIGEYFGDVMLVNGKVWPYLDVEPRLYRFRVLNGCNARILDLNIGGVPCWQIGAEGGMWDRPVAMRHLVLAPAERADVVVDFRQFAGGRPVITSVRPAQPISTPAPSLVTVMQLRVGTTVSEPGPTAVPASLPGVAANLPAPARTRYFTLNEIAAETAAWTLNIDGAPFQPGESGPTPTAGSVEEWVYLNLTADTHPIHPHLTTFQVIGRTPFDAEAFEDAYEGPQGVPGGIDPTPFITGPMRPPAPDERGFKDTVKANPGELTTIRARFDLPTAATGPQTYVHHCHILEHEDNDMMRAFTVVPG